VTALVLLDRDGTLCEPAASRYVLPHEARLLPGAAGAVRRLNEAGVVVAVLTNQRGVATGELRAADVDAVNAVLSAELATAGAHVDSWYVCPHDVGECRCRKPAPGLVERALREHPTATPAQSWLVGDAESDVLAGAAVGVPGVLLAARPPAGTAAAAVVPDLSHAVALILGPKHHA
jgi:histidinol-phosphate phosphatase family protein